MGTVQRATTARVRKLVAAQNVIKMKFYSSTREMQDSGVVRNELMLWMPFVQERLSQIVSVGKNSATLTVSVQNTSLSTRTVQSPENAFVSVITRTRSCSAP